MKIKHINHIAFHLYFKVKNEKFYEIFDFNVEGDQCPGFLFRNVYCYQSGEGMIEDSLCTDDVAGEKPQVAKACDEEEGSGEESTGPQVSFYTIIISTLYFDDTIIVLIHS